ncbi:MAG: sigma-70 family RNA polymerase sigma factor [Phycisphaerae bacterium]
MVTDEQLLADYLTGQQSAFAELVQRYQQELFAFLQRFVSDAQVAEDLFQETFVQVHRNARSFDPARSFRPWLFTIAANKARDYLRAAGRRGTQSLDNSTGRDETTTFLDLLEADGPPPLAELTQAEGIAKVQQVLAELPATYREVLILSYFHRFAYKQMAEMLNVPLGTVKSRLHGALAYFARAYRRQYGDPDLS